MESSPKSLSFAEVVYITSSTPRLPPELIAAVIAHCTPHELTHVARTSRILHLFATPNMYRDIRLAFDRTGYRNAALKTLTYLATRPDLATMVRSLSITSSEQGKTGKCSTCYSYRMAGVCHQRLIPQPPPSQMCWDLGRVRPTGAVLTNDDIRGVANYEPLAGCEYTDDENWYIFWARLCLALDNLTNLQSLMLPAQATICRIQSECIRRASCILSLRTVQLDVLHANTVENGSDIIQDPIIQLARQCTTLLFKGVVAFSRNWASGEAAESLFSGIASCSPIPNLMLICDESTTWFFPQFYTRDGELEVYTKSVGQLLNSTKGISTIRIRLAPSQLSLIHLFIASMGIKQQEQVLSLELDFTGPPAQLQRYSASDFVAQISPLINLASLKLWQSRQSRMHHQLRFTEEGVLSAAQSYGMLSLQVVQFHGAMWVLSGGM
ncbi:hypothetical protein BKA62DRAFT_786825 [Auriculariales sp. MPI-PUGE-AT-0066]|nr:hypothetical protein BKA62DRAFT_786825 [Auriculariales sp. MPI-PUGE-AT-0066]